jgi:hypothetical protein
MKDAPCDCRSCRLVGDFLQHPCFAATPRHIACAPGGSVKPRAFIFFDDFSLEVVRGPLAGLLSITPTAFCCGHRPSFRDPATITPLAIRPAAYPEDLPDSQVDSGVAENTPGNKLSCSVLNLFPGGTHISVLGNCLSSSTATPPSEHTPLRRRCCSEPVFDFHRPSTEADRRRPIPSFLKEAPLSPGGASAFSAFPGHTDVWCLLQWVTASYIPMKLPKRDINARQKALQKNVLPTILTGAP